MSINYKFRQVFTQLPQIHILLVVSCCHELVVVPAKLSASNFGATLDLVIVLLDHYKEIVSTFGYYVFSFQICSFLKFILLAL